MRTILKISILSLFLMLQSLGALAFVTIIKINTKPTEAKIYLNDEFIGTGAATYTVDGKQRFVIRVESPGYVTKYLKYLFKSKVPEYLSYDREDFSIEVNLEKENAKQEIQTNKVNTPIISKKDERPEKPVKQEVVTNLTPADVYKANTITFYGYDFSHMKFVEEKREEQGERIVEVIKKWQQIINEHNTDKYYQRTMKIENIVMKTKYGEEQSYKANPNAIIGSTQVSLNKEDIQKWLKEYKFTETQGIGYIIFIDCFYKPKKNTALSFVFFDIATKQILILDKYDANEADGYGLPHYWAQGVTATIGKYNGHVFKKNKKK